MSTTQQVVDMFLNAGNMPASFQLFQAGDYAGADRMAAEFNYNHINMYDRLFIANQLVRALSAHETGNVEQGVNMFIDIFNAARYTLPSNDAIMIVIMTLIYRVAMDCMIAKNVSGAIFYASTIMDATAAWHAIDPSGQLKLYTMLLLARCNQRLCQWSEARTILHRLYEQLTPDTDLCLRVYVLRRLIIQYSKDNNMEGLQRAHKEAKLACHMILNSVHPPTQADVNVAHRMLAVIDEMTQQNPSEASNDRKRKAPYADLDNGVWGSDIDIEIEGENAWVVAM
jgi:hypothetical protein